MCKEASKPRGRITILVATRPSHVPVRVVERLSLVPVGGAVGTSGGLATWIGLLRAGGTGRPFKPATTTGSRIEPDIRRRPSNGSTNGGRYDVGDPPGFFRKGFGAIGPGGDTKSATAGIVS